uniref:Uncharacterized protein n=1 Tax=Ciconia boyciana CRESS-DNA-virus sp. TaxID=2815024 RepID=A0A8A4XCH5_9VIRU|nr:MAG: hypothetical protein [Ciconia boyciana CRESS-DNA-virus sp.]
MTSTTKDEIFTTFNLSCDSPYTVNISNSGVPSVIFANWVGLQLNKWQDLRNKYPEQMGRLLTLFNNYQQWTIEKISYTFVPRWPNAVQGEADLNGGGNQNIAAVSRFGPGTTVTWVQDIDDSEPRSSLEEYFQVRDQPNAKSHLATQRSTYSYNPFMMDTIAQNSQFSDSTINTDDTESPHTNQTVPTPLRWFSTKAHQGNAAGPIVINQNLGLMGVKTYAYSPYNTNNLITPQTSITIGMVQENYTFKFKFPEYRGLSLVYGEGEEAARSDMNALIQLQGEAARFTTFGGNKPYLSELGAAITQNREQTNQIPGPTYEATIKRMRDDYQDDTQPDPKRQETLADHGSKQT